jgi:hypothetical protein
MEKQQEIFDTGDPGRNRTCDLQLRRLLLYPLSYGAGKCSGLAHPTFAIGFLCAPARWAIDSMKRALAI